MRSRRFPPVRYPWADPAYELVQASMVPCCADLAAALRGKKPAAATAEDKLEPSRLVLAADESPERDDVVGTGDIQ